MINYNLFLIKCFANSQYYISFFIKIKKKDRCILQRKSYIYMNCCEIYMNNKYTTNVVYYYI